MLQFIFLYGWELLVNATEVTLFLYLISHKLIFKYHKLSFFIFSFILLISVTCVLNYFQVPPTVSFLTIFVVNILYVVHFFKNSLTEKLFWGGSHTFIALFSENFAFWLYSILTHDQISDYSMGSKMRIPLSLLYLLSFMTFVLIFKRMKEERFCLPKPFLMALILLTTLSVIISDSILGLIISIDTGNIPSDISRSLNKLNYLFLFLFLALLLMIKWVGSVYKRHLELVETVKQQQIEQQQFEIFVSTTQALREWKHDYKNNLSVISLLLDDENLGKAKSFINELMNSVSDHVFMLSSGNSALDAIVSTKLSKAREHHIDFQHTIFLPDNIPFSAIDFSTIMGNLLDNAIEACLNIDSTMQPYIILQIERYQDMLYIQVQNSSNGNYRYNSSGELISIKSEQGHGIGVRRIKQVTEKYNGIYQQLPEADKFTLTVMVPLKITEEENCVNDYKISDPLG